MTRLITDRPRTSTDDYRQSVRDVLDRAAGQPPALSQSGNSRLVATPPASRTLGRVRDLLPWPQAATVITAANLAPLTRVETYAWSSDTYLQQARRWLATILETLTTTSWEGNQAARSTLTFLVGAILDLASQDADLYQLGRATDATQDLPDAPTPLRREQIPQSLWDEQGREYDLRFTSLRWENGTPAAAANRLATVSVRAMPDAWWLATYALPPRQVAPLFTYDPLIYAQYGEWFVVVAQWDDPPAE